jgi:hypothetical protein
MTGIEANFSGAETFRISGNLVDIFIQGRRTKADCGEDGMRFGVVYSSSYLNGETTVVLDDTSDDLTDNLSQIWYETEPHMPDGRPIVRSDTRPLDMMTYFLMAGDDSTSIGGGVELRWDFTNNDNLYTGPEVPIGYKAKMFLVSFLCPVHLKDGTIYHFDAPWGQYVLMDVVVPAGWFYPNPSGEIPAVMLGMSGNAMYSQATKDTPIQRYVNKHFMYKDCPMGDELNAEGCSIDALPVGWFIRGIIVTPESDNVSKGFASLEIYRCHTSILPGQNIDDLH